MSAQNNAAVETMLAAHDDATATGNLALDMVIDQIEKADPSGPIERAMASYYRGKIDAITTWLHPSVEKSRAAHAAHAQFEKLVSQAEAERAK